MLMKWFPGWMSAPHTYVTDRLCVVVSGVWWCNSGPDFDPGNAVPVYPGGFVCGWHELRITMGHCPWPPTRRQSR